MSLIATLDTRARAAVTTFERRVALQKAATTLLFVLLALMVVSLQTWHFTDRRNYRDDEIRTVHAGLTMSPSEVVQWMSIDIHPPFWRVMATIWVSLFGPDEAITRFHSSLTVLLLLALMYRLMADHFGRTTALVATFLLGTHALLLFYTHELRPYAALLMWVLATHLFFLRWLRRPGFLYGALYVLSCAGALYTHFFAIYTIAGQVVAFLLLVRWNPGLYLRAFGLWLAAGLSFLGWLPSFLHSYLISQPGGIGYSIPLDDPGSAGLLFDSLQIRPYSIGTLLTLAGLLLPFRRRFVPMDVTFRLRSWPKWYFVIGAVVGFVLVILTDLYVVSVLTNRNLIPLLPAIALLGALCLRALPWQATLLVLPLILNPAVRDFMDFQRNQPYREVLAFVRETYDDHEPVIISVDQGTGSYFTYAYTLLDRLPGRIDQSDMFYLTLGGPDINLPDPPLNHVTDASPANLERFADLTRDADEVFWIWSSDEAPYVQTYRDALLAEGFQVTRSEQFSSYGSEYVVEAYRQR
jgi:hypothetical protein